MSDEPPDQVPKALDMKSCDKIVIGFNNHEMMLEKAKKPKF